MLVVPPRWSGAKMLLVEEESGVRRVGEQVFISLWTGSQVPTPRKERGRCCLPACFQVACLLHHDASRLLTQDETTSSATIYPHTSCRFPREVAGVDKTQGYKP